MIVEDIILTHKANVTAQDIEIRDSCADKMVWIAIAMLLLSYAATSQPHFQFIASRVVDISDTVYIERKGGFEVYAANDSLFIGIPSKPILWRGIRWERARGGGLRFENPFVSLVYSPGVGQRVLDVQVRHLIHFILYENPSP